jgi:DNA-binding winged helix-turn-helix (wHTH) protein
MRVNSSFTGFFTNRLLVNAGIAIMMFAIFYSASSFKDPSDRDLLVKEVNLMIRQIGHRLLLQAGDSTSRVLPVTETKEGTFLLRFEKKLIFNHDSLWQLSQVLLPKTQFPSGYTVTVQDCKKGDIVYGFQVNNTTPDILPCLGRNQPKGCYTMEFVFPDLRGNIEEGKTAIYQRINESKPGKVDLQEGNPKLAELKATGIDDNIDQGISELKSAKPDLQEVNAKPEKNNQTSFNSALTNVVYPSLVLLLAVTIIIMRFRKKVNRAPDQDQDLSVIKEPDPEYAVLGKFLFNAKAQRLLLGNEVITLTDKECKVLELLHKNFGELIPRETLMQEVWINEGVITGRSLDMFVSKLRKKLSSDPELRISNVHGKGYKLEMAERAII